MEDEQFASWVDKRFQSWKDKRLDRHETEIGNLQSGLAEYRKVKEEIESLKQAGFTEQQAEIFIERGTPAPQPESPGKTEAVASEFKADDILRAQGIDPNSPEGVEIIRKSSNANELIANVIERKSKPAHEPPSAASSMPEGTGASLGTRTLDEVNAELQKAMTDSKGLNFEKIRKLEEEHRQLLKK
jgi:hypothetical protein